MEPVNSPAARLASSSENSLAKKERIMNIKHRTLFGKQSPCLTSHPSAWASWLHRLSMSYSALRLIAPFVPGSGSPLRSGTQTHLNSGRGRAERDRTTPLNTQHEKPQPVTQTQNFHQRPRPEQREFRTAAPWLTRRGLTAAGRNFFPPQKSRQNAISPMNSASRKSVKYSWTLGINHTGEAPAQARALRLLKFLPWNPWLMLRLTPP